MKSCVAVLIASLSLTAAACAHEARPALEPGGQAGTDLHTTSAPADGRAVALSDSLRSVCGIADTGSAPRFDFDAAVLTPGDRAELDQLAKCMTTGPLAGKNVELVGRADPRGEVEYNMTLGARRADAVEHYLAQLGVAPDRLPTTSRGALDAQGHDEVSWAMDRRVDLRLAGR